MLEAEARQKQAAISDDRGAVQLQLVANQNTTRVIQILMRPTT